MSVLLGFLALGIGTTSAYIQPATGYELSIYTGTPFLFWILIGFALLLSLVFTFSSISILQPQVGVFLAGLSIATIVSLPLIRGYYWIGGSDSLTHLGWTREINTGVIEPTELIYPAVHTLGSIVSKVTGVDVRHSLMLLVPTFVLVFIIFIPLVVKELTHDQFLTNIAFFSGLLLLPINHLAAQMQIHITSQAIMFSPVLLYIFVRIFKNREWRERLLFLVASSLFIVLHPQQAANYVLFFGAVIGIKIIYSQFYLRQQESETKSINVVLIIFVLMWWIWVYNLARFDRALAGVIQRLFTETTVAETIQTRSVSVELVGGSLEEVFFKLFFVSLLYCICAGVLMTAIGLNAFKINFESLRKYLPSYPLEQRTFLLYLTVGFLPVASVFFIYLGLGIRDQYFRHYGFIMVFVTILGAIALGRLLKWFEIQGPNSLGTATTIITIGLLLLLTVPVIFSSPYIYQDSGHTPESAVVGYDTHFQYSTMDTYLFTRERPNRYADAILGSTLSSDITRTRPPDHFADRDLPEYIGNKSYFGITQADRQQDAVLWDGFRFSKNDYKYLENDPEINQIHTNGGFDMYLVMPANQDDTTEQENDVTSR